MATVVYFDEQRMLILDCIDVHGDPGPALVALLDVPSDFFVHIWHKGPLCIIYKLCLLLLKC